MNLMIRIGTTATALVAFLTWSQVTSAATINLMTNAGAVQQTSMVDNFLVNANQLAGMNVQALFSDGSMESLIWTDMGGATGGVTGTNWSMTATGNALNSVTLTNNRAESLVEFLMDGGPGDGVFDIGAPAFTATRTPNTNIGNSFQVNSEPEDLTYNVVYFDPVRINMLPPNGDIFRSLRVGITGGASIGGGLGSGDVLRWNTDMDALSIAGDIRPVPAPTTLALLLGGLGSGALIRRRRRGATPIV